MALSTDVFRGGSFMFPEPQPKSRSISEFLQTQKRQDDYFYFDIKNNRLEPRQYEIRIPSIAIMS